MIKLLICGCYVCKAKRKATISRLKKEVVANLFCKGEVTLEELEERFKQKRVAKMLLKSCIFKVGTAVK